MSTKLFIANVNPEMRIRDLENCFGRHGKILQCDIKRNYAFIEFSDPRDAEMALRKEDGQELLGSQIVVEFAHGKGRGGGRYGRVPNSPPPRGGFGGGRPRSPPYRESRYHERSPVVGRRSPTGPPRGYDDDRFAPRRSFDNFCDAPRYRGSPPLRFNNRYDNRPTRRPIRESPPPRAYERRDRYISDSRRY